MKKFRYDIQVKPIDDDAFCVLAIDILDENDGYHSAFKVRDDVTLNKIVGGLNACLQSLFRQIYEDNNAELIEEDIIS